MKKLNLFLLQTFSLFTLKKVALFCLLFLQIVNGYGQSLTTTQQGTLEYNKLIITPHISNGQTIEYLDIYIFKMLCPSNWSNCHQAKGVDLYKSINGGAYTSVVHHPNQNWNSASLSYGTSQASLSYQGVYYIGSSQYLHFRYHHYDLSIHNAGSIDFRLTGTYRSTTSGNNYATEHEYRHIEFKPNYGDWIWSSELPITTTDNRIVFNVSNVGHIPLSENCFMKTRQYYKDLNGVSQFSLYETGIASSFTQTDVIHNDLGPNNTTHPASHYLQHRILESNYTYARRSVCQTGYPTTLDVPLIQSVSVNNKTNSACNVAKLSFSPLSSSYIDAYEYKLYNSENIEVGSTTGSYIDVDISEYAPGETRTLYLKTKAKYLPSNVWHESVSSFPVEVSRVSIPTFVNSADYSYTMSITAQVAFESSLSLDSNDLIVVQDNVGTCLGFAYVDATIGSLAGNFAFLTVYSNSVSATYNVYLYDASTGEVSDAVAGGLNFESNAIVGNPLNPVVFSTSQSVIAACTNSNYLEYNAEADVLDENSCTNLIVEGCSDSTYLEYNAAVNVGVNSYCLTLLISACTNPDYIEFNPLANTDDGSCSTTWQNAFINSQTVVAEQSESIVSLNSTVTTLTNSVSSLESSNVILTSSLETVNSTNSQLEIDLTESLNNAASLTNTVDDLSTLSTQQSSSIVFLENENTALTSSLVAVNSTNTQLEIELTASLNNAANLTNTVDDLSVLSTQQSLSIVLLETENTTLTDSLVALNSTNTQLEIDLAESLNNSANLANSVDDLFALSTQQSSSIELLENENTTLMSSLLSVNSANAQLEIDLISSLNNAATLTDSVTDLSYFNGEQSDSIFVLNAEIEMQNSTVADLEIELTASLNNAANLTNTVDGLSALSTQQSSSIVLLENENTALTSSLVSVNSANAQLEIDLISSLNNAATLTDSVTDLSAFSTQQSSSIVLLEDENTTLTDSLVSLNSTNTHLEIDLAESLNNAANLTNTVDDLSDLSTQQSSNIVFLETENTTLTSSLLSVNSANAQLEVDLISSLNNAANLIDSVTDLSYFNVEQSDSILVLNTEIEMQNSTVADLEIELTASLNNSATLTNTVTDLSAFSTQQSSSIVFLEDENTNLTDSLVAVNSTNTQLEIDLVVSLNNAEDGVSQSDVDIVQVELNNSIIENSVLSNSISNLESENATQLSNLSSLNFELTNQNVTVDSLQSALISSIANEEEHSLVDRYIDLPEGWSMFGFNCTVSKDVEEFFNAYSGNIEIIKDELGLSYLPEWGFNALGSLQYGEGYQIKTNQTIGQFQFCPNIE